MGEARGASPSCMGEARGASPYRKGLGTKLAQHLLILNCGQKFTICSYAHTYQTTQNWSPELLVYGDMGRHGGAESLPALIEEVASRDYAAILHVGDFAYDLDSQGGVVREKSTSVTYGGEI